MTPVLAKMVLSLPNVIVLRSGRNEGVRARRELDDRINRLLQHDVGQHCSIDKRTASLQMLPGYFGRVSHQGLVGQVSAEQRLGILLCDEAI